MGMIGSSMEPAVTLNFGNLPLVEAAVRVALQAPLRLSYNRVNAIHADLKDQFPQLTEPTQFEVAPGVKAVHEMRPDQLSGVVYLNDETGLRVTVQPRVIVARWVKRFAANAPEYPRFVALKDALWQTVQAARSASGDDFPAIHVTNMSYVNFVQVEDPATILADYFSALAQIKATENATQIRKVEGSWAEGDTDLRFTLQQASAKIDDQEIEGYQLTTAAGRRLAEDTDAKSALDKVHARLQVFFRDLISKRAKIEWQLDEA